MQSIQVPSKAGVVLAVVGALAVNAIPIVGVMFWGWSAFALILLYWLENVVVGVRTLLSMAASGVTKGWLGLGLVFLLPFFTLHYGLFTFVHGVFVMAMFGGAEMAQLNVDTPFGLAGVVSALFREHPNLLIGFAAIAAWQGVHFIVWLARGEAGRSDPITQMSAPYPRIITLHITIIFGGFLLMLLGWPVLGVLALAVMKTLFDVGEARRFGEGREAAKPWAEMQGAFMVLRRRSGAAPAQSPAASPAIDPAPRSRPD
ncbi:MAG: DUF6498-containing protein [Hyphomonadaceae bacterium]